MKNNIPHIILAILLVIFLTLLSDSFMLWMPTMMTMSILLVVVVIMSIWSGFIMKEQAVDERELIHRMNAGRVAYLSGTALLTLALIVQGLNHHIDPWIAYTLSIMVISKLIARIYFESNQ